MGLSCLWKQLFAVGSTTEVKYKSFEQRSSCKVPTLAQSSNAIEVEWVSLRRFNALRNWVLLLSCDYVLKFDRYCKLSGTRRNSLNSWKLPGHFSYSLETTLTLGW